MPLTAMEKNLTGGGQVSSSWQHYLQVLATWALQNNSGSSKAITSFYNPIAEVAFPQCSAVSSKLESVLMVE